MLVCAAMAERPRAAASGKSRPAPTTQAPGPDAARHSTARVATIQGARQSELPGWFWTALGCMTVLVIGLTVVFFVFQPSVAPTEAAAAPLPAAATTTVVPSVAEPAADAPRPPAQGIRVERMASPPPAIDQAPAAPVAKPKAPRPVKVARTPAPSAKPAAAAAKPAAAESSDEDLEEELLKPKQRPAATAQDDDSEEK